MSTTPDTEILIKARNLTADAFAEVAKTMEKLASSQKDGTKEAEAGWEQLFGTISGGVFAGELLERGFEKVLEKLAEIPGELLAITQQGSRVADVEQAFDRLAAGAGGARAVLAQLREGTQGTITDFELMQVANRSLSDGMRLSAGDFGVMAAGARLLARQTGGDTTEAFEALNQAMATGRARALNLIGVHVDADAAQGRYSATIRKSVADFTDQDRVASNAAEVMRQLRARLAEAGDQQLSFNERQRQITTTLANFEEDLGKAIARSPVLAAGYAAIGRELTGAFGGKDELIRQISGAVNTLALMSAEAGSAGVEAMRVVGDAVFGYEQIYYSAIREMADRLLDFIGPSRAAAAVLQQIPGAAGAAFALAGAGMDKMIGGLATLDASATGWRDKMIVGGLEWDAKAGGWKASIDRVVASMYLATAAAGAAGDAGKRGGDRAGGSWKDAAKAAESFAKALQGFVDRGSLVNETRDALALQAAITLLGGESALSASAFRAFAGEAAKLRDVGVPVTAELLQLAEAHDLLEKAALNTKAAMEGEADAYKRSNQAAGAYLTTLPTAIWQTTSYAGAVQMVSAAAAGYQGNLSGATRATFEWTDAIEASLADLGKDLSADGVIGGLKTFGTDVATDFVGGVLDAVPVVGPELAQFAGVIVSGFKKAFGNLFNTAGRDAVKNFAAQFNDPGLNDGFDNLLAKLDAIGRADLWKGLTQGVGKADAEAAKQEIAAVQAALDRVNGEIEKYALSWKDLSDPTRMATGFKASADALLGTFNDLQRAGYSDSAIVRQMGGDLNQLISDAESTGQKIPPALEPMLETFIRGGGLTDDLKRKLQGLGDTGPSFDDVKNAASSLGVDIDKLGPKVDQLRFTDELEADAAQLKVLQGAGADMGSVYDQMKGKMQDYVTTALREGLQLPESMKPFIDQMIDAGDLTDDLGNKLTDDSKLSWATTLNDDVEDLVGAMKDLVDVIKNDVGGALRDVGNSVFRPSIRPSIDDGDLPDPGYGSPTIGRGASSSSAASSFARSGAAATSAASSRPVQLVITGSGRRVLATAVLEDTAPTLGAYGAARRI